MPCEHGVEFNVKRIQILSFKISDAILNEFLDLKNNPGANNMLDKEPITKYRPLLSDLKPKIIE